MDKFAYIQMHTLRYGHEEWRGHPYALNLRGRPRIGTPDNNIRMQPRQKRVHSFVVREYQ